MYYYLNIFFLFSIIGHFIENFVYVHVDSGILFGFWTPIYGFGVVLILIINHILKKLKVNKYISLLVRFYINIRFYFKKHINVIRYYFFQLIPSF